MTESSRMTLDQYRTSQALAHGFKRGNKYNAKRTLIDGIWFDSKLEAGRYRELKALQGAGDVAWFICQVPFRLPGGIIYRADFLVVWHSHPSLPRGSPGVTVEDCKGARTRVSINKIKQVEEIYGINVQLITRVRKR